MLMVVRNATSHHFSASSIISVGACTFLTLPHPEVKCQRHIDRELGHCKFGVVIYDKTAEASDLMRRKAGD